MKKINLEVERDWKPTGGNEAFFSDVHSKLIREAACRLGINIDHIDSKTFFLNYSGKSVLFMYHLPELTAAASRYISNDKHSTKIFLERAGVKTPKGSTFSSDEYPDALKYAKKIGFPVVLKPISGSGGSGVTSNIKDENHFNIAWNETSTPNRRYIVEKHVHGNDHRILVVNGRYVCAAQRIPVNVTGDGISTIKELIEAKNIVRSQNPYVGAKKVKLTNEMRRNLKKLDYDEESILPDGLNIQLLPVANIGTGGDSKDVTEDVHPAFIEIAIKAAHAIPGCFFAGVDLLVPDISKSPDEQEYSVCEINTRPDIGMHHFPIIGKARDAAGSILKEIFPSAFPVTEGAMKKVKVTLSGEVIGTGTRKFIEKISSLNNIRGWVKNHGNEVIALICGEKQAVDRTILSIAERNSTKISVSPWAGDIPIEFKIKY